MIIAFEGTTDGSVYLSRELFDLLQNSFLQLIVAHSHDGVDARKIYDEEIKIGEKDGVVPVGFDEPENYDEYITLKEHVENTAIHTFSSAGVPGRLVAKGWTEPVYTRFVIATPIFEKGNPFPFPTYNMSPIQVSENFIYDEQDITSDEFLNTTLETSFSRHDIPEGYSPYRHYLYMLPPYGVFNIDSRHLDYIDGRSLVFSFTPVFVDAKDTELITEIKSGVADPKEISSCLEYDYQEERIWSKYESSTCLLGGYKTVSGSNQKAIALYFTDYHNEFNQLISQMNYQAKKISQHFTPTISDNAFGVDLAQVDTVFDPRYEWNEKIKASILGDDIFRPYFLVEKDISISEGMYIYGESLGDFLMSGLGGRHIIHKYGLRGYALFKNVTNAFVSNYVLGMPEYFEGGTYQLFGIRDILSEKEVSSEIRFKGSNDRILYYMVKEGYVTVPYEIWSYEGGLAEGEVGVDLKGEKDALEIDVVDVLVVEDYSRNISLLDDPASIPTSPGAEWGSEDWTTTTVTTTTTSGTRTVTTSGVFTDDSTYTESYTYTEEYTDTEEVSPPVVVTTPLDDIEDTDSEEESTGDEEPNGSVSNGGEETPGF